MNVYVICFLLLKFSKQNLASTTSHTTLLNCWGHPTLCVSFRAMLTSCHGNAFRITYTLRGESNVQHWISFTMVQWSGALMSLAWIICWIQLRSSGQLLETPWYSYDVTVIVVPLTYLSCNYTYTFIGTPFGRWLYEYMLHTSSLLAMDLQHLQNIDHRSIAIPSEMRVLCNETHDAKWAISSALFYNWWEI